MAALSVSAALWMGTPSVYAMPDIMPLQDVAEGMQGVLYTVVDSSGELRSFPLHVLGVMSSGRGSMPYILARSEGPFADTDGGLLQGMSGSPVYVDGLLIGAASATVSDMDPHTFLITPIEEMLPIWDMPDKKNKTRVKTIDIKKAAEERAKIEKEMAEKDKKKAEKEAEKNKEEKKDDKKSDKDEAEKPKEEKTDSKTDAGGEAKGKAYGSKADTEKKYPSAGKEPEFKGSFVASGFGAEGLSMLREKLASVGYKAESYGGFSTGNATTLYGAELEPGEAVGAAVIYGDFAMAATGTVTAVDDNRVLAFGHPFLHRGNVNYFMTDATILGMVNGVSDGMKFANTKHIIGRIIQDRAAGISGEIGVFPSVVPIRLNVKDKTLNRDVKYTATMAYDEDFIPLLSPTVSYAALNRTVDTGGESTVEVHFTVRTNAVESGTVERTNMFYAAADAGQAAFGELGQAMGLICSDKEKEADIMDITVDISSAAERRTASLVSAIPDRPEVRPGDTVNFKVTLKPYRAEKVTVSVPFTVPKVQREGIMHLDVHGGGLVSVEQLLAAMQGQGVVSADDNDVTTEDQLKNLMESPANNEIIIEPGAGPVMSEKEQQKAIKEAIRAQEEAEKNPDAAKEEQKPPVGRKLTDYVIDNVIHAMVTVSKDAPEPEKEPVEFKLDDILKKVMPKNEAKADAKTDAKSDVKNETKADTKAEAKDEAKADTKAEAKNEAKSDAKADVKNESKADADKKAEVKNEAKAADAAEKATEAAKENAGEAAKENAGAAEKKE